VALVVFDAGAADWQAVPMAWGEMDSASQLLRQAEHEVLLYGMTPPRLATTPEHADEIAQATLKRLEGVNPDGLIIYDVDAELDRSPDPRPFPFMPMMDPAEFANRHLSGWAGPLVIYRAVGKYREADLRGWLTTLDVDRVLLVLVGAASRDQAMKTRLADAYRLHAGLDRQPTVGGVRIAERHVGTRQEHRRMLSKQGEGCEFFVPQVCYDLDHTRPPLRLRLHLPRPGLSAEPGHRDAGALRLHEDPRVHGVAGHRCPALAAHRDRPGRGPR
jgi:hypothetical protein